MTKVVDLAQARTVRNPHVEGPARCLRCDFKWKTKTPIGRVIHLECPQCHAMMGTMLLHVAPPEGQPVLTCHCGNQHFMLTPHAIYCLNCGAAQSRPPDLTT